MAQQHGVNTLAPETVACSEAAAAQAIAKGRCIPALKGKYTNVGQSKKTRDKGGGNSGNVGRRWRRKQRGYAGGQVSNEEKIRREAQSKFSRENQKPKVMR